MTPLKGAICLYEPELKLNDLFLIRTRFHKTPKMSCHYRVRLLQSNCTEYIRAAGQSDKHRAKTDLRSGEAGANPAGSRSSSEDRETVKNQ